jgi:uncharacterized protein YqiB (DUF1249 family)
LRQLFSKNCIERLSVRVNFRKLRQLFSKNCIERLSVRVNFKKLRQLFSKNCIERLSVRVNFKKLRQLFSKNCIENRYFSKLFFAKFTNASKSPFINASFLALDHFLICFSVSIAKLISVNSQ